MEIYRFALEDLAAEFNKELTNGNHYMVTECFSPLGTVSREYFRDEFAAAESAYENTTDLDFYEYYKLKELADLVELGQKHAWRLPEVIQLQYLIILKTTIMEENNVKYLENDLKYAGFNERLNVQLKENIEKGLKDFTLNDKVDIGKDKMSYFLHFKQGEKNKELYFFNSFDAILKKEGKTDEVKQTFYQNQHITAKEAYNLLDGRAVYKTMDKYQKPEPGEEKKPAEKYNTWLKIDFSKMNAKGNNHELATYSDGWGYDIKKRLEALPLQENKFEDAQEKILRDLKKGNIVPVTVEALVHTSTIYLEAHPVKKDFKSYDENRVPQRSDTLKEYREAKHDDLKMLDLDDKMGKAAAQKATQNPEQNNAQAEEQKQGRGRRKSA